MRPIDHCPDGRKLLCHGFDVFHGPVFGMNSSFDGRIFRGKTKCVKAVRKENIETVHSFISGVGVRWSKSKPMTQMKIAGRIWKFD